MSNERTRLEASARDARLALKTIEAVRDEEIRAAKGVITEAHYPLVVAATQAIRDAVVALNSHIDASAAHPLEGRQVYRDRKDYRGFGYKPNIIREVGVVQVRRQDTELPANLGDYSLPVLGEAFVRKVGKDGKPGKAIYSRCRIEEWKPLEHASGTSAGTAETAQQAQGDSPQARPDAQSSPDRRTP